MKLKRLTGEGAVEVEERKWSHERKGQTKEMKKGCGKGQGTHNTVFLSFKEHTLNLK